MNYLIQWTIIGLMLLVPAHGAGQHEVTYPLQLAQPLTEPVKVSEYFVSEKLDGIRARWTGEKLVTRNGNKIHTPDWFIAGWPDTVMDGELWIARGQFEETASVVLSETPDNRWREVRLMLFDLPTLRAPFYQRVEAMNRLVTETRSPYLSVIPQYTLTSNEALDAELEAVTAAGGEGLMLHHKQAMYENGRTPSLLKAKRYDDDEARVIRLLPGKGKFTDLMGALLVETRQGVRFKIGTGFSLEQRQSPPPVGTWITFKYYGFTARGIPRFASFMRIKPTPPAQENR
ncbi:DNA ligase [Salinimonas sp. HHU 13199]|uniref:DNA ligase n=1 Tax=Salinimonas profundi TaxID=2729140 RepID=A0ABR8LQ38_9ALTE|nr:DNA ligase [Salinimonas profundi]MBD3587488.1 DNA ligase [Salinimonas profundi]